MCLQGGSVAEWLPYRAVASILGAGKQVDRFRLSPSKHASEHSNHSTS